MKSIQVDAYAVGLGSSILTQFALQDGGVVRVLADGGVQPGYAESLVHGKLSESVAAFEGNANRIDLVLATHYDSDHLRGLLPIVSDEQMSIGEIWLPPIKDDTETILPPVEEEDYLCEKFFADSEDTFVRSFLLLKAKELSDLARVEKELSDQLAELFPELRNREGIPAELRSSTELLEKRFAEAKTRSELVAEARRHYALHAQDAGRRAGDSFDHGVDIYDSRESDLTDLARSFRHRWEAREPDLVNLIRRNTNQRTQLVPSFVARIRASAAKEAIQHAHLNDLVAALRNRSSPIRPKCYFTPVGRPLAFRWNDQERRFVPRFRNQDASLSLTLLGPSEELVTKYRERLPIGTYALAMLYDPTPMKRASITASNQLSYICVLEMDDQRILISGDAGCYGFRDGSKSFFPDLIDLLAPLHVIQVAHHAGRNYDFYHSLLASALPAQEDDCFLLLCHKVNDRDRPSAIFRRFVLELGKDAEWPTLLFTSQPTPQRVVDFRCLVGPSASPIASEGDVRLSFRPDSNPSWTIEKHAIAV